MFSNTIRGLLLWFIILNWGAAVNAGDDSCRNKGSLRLRLHSSGFFPYSGRLINLHPSGDIVGTYEKPFISAYVFQSLDLQTRNSDINYFQAGLYRWFHLSDTWSVTPYAIIEIPQNGKWFNSPYAIGGASVLFSPHTSWQIENTTLWADGFKKADRADIVHRLRLTYAPSHRWEWTGFVWANAAAFDHQSFYSAAVMGSVSLFSQKHNPDIRLSVMLFQMLRRDQGVGGKNRGIQCSLSIPWSYGSSAR